MLFQTILILSDEKQLFFQHTARKVFNNIQDKVFNDPHDR